MDRNVKRWNSWAAMAVLIMVVAATGCSGPTTPEPGPAPVAAILSVDSVATLGGRDVDVPIRLTYTGDPSEQLGQFGGFEIFLEYDASALTFVSAKKGADVSSWEYWTWRTYGFPNNSNAEQRAVRIVSVRDMNNGVAPDPPQYYPDGIIGTLRFWVTLDYDFVNTCAAVWFHLAECSDNTLSSGFQGQTICMPDTSLGDPSIAEGYAPPECRDYDSVSAWLELRSGKVTIEEPPPIPGDVNLNGIPFEIGDLTFFTELFDGRTPDVDPEIVPKMIANADCNGDGEALTISDLEYLMRVLLGTVRVSDPLPSPYVEYLNIGLVQEGTDWLVTGTASSPVTGLLIQVISPSGAGLSAEWLGRPGVSFSAKVRNDTLRILATADFRTLSPILEGDWPPPIRILNAGDSGPEIAGAQASVTPGSPMAVNISP